jgi:hypothetical protein
VSNEGISYKIDTPSDLDKAFQSIDRNATRVLNEQPCEIILRRYEEPRNRAQNKKLWAMLGDFVRCRVEISGRNDWTQENWKCFIMSAFNGEMPAVGLNGEPVTMGSSTSRLSKKRFAELIEFIYATGTMRCVKWSETAQAVYDEYKEMQEGGL